MNNSNLNSDPENRFAPFRPLKMDYLERPYFSFDWLPSCALKTLAEEIARYNCVKPDLPAITTLGYVAAMAQGRMGITMKTGKRFELNIFLAAAAESGQRKSTVHEYFRNMVWDFEHETEETPQIVIKHATFLAVLKRCAANEERLLLASGDAGGIIHDLTKYTNHNLDLLLMSQNAESYTYDTGKSGEVHLKHPIISMLLLAQYEPIDKMYNTSLLRARGFLSRCLIAYLHTQKIFDDNEHAIDEEVLKRAEADLYSLLRDPIAEDGDIRLSDEATEHYWKYKKELDARIDLNCIEDWKVRIPENLFKIIGILQAMEYGVEAPLSPVTKDTVDKATKIMDYFIDHALFAVAKNSNPQMDDTHYLKKKISDLAAKSGTLSERELKQSTKSHFKKRDGFTDAIGILIEHGYIRVYKRQTGGRPSTIIELNPEAFENHKKAF